uniref:Protein translocase subunit SecA n=1 Tax=Phaeocystis globosa TaxID=33658 RepID=A0A891ZM47_9EUKA|nr:preprotein translocase subunit SecA [Phaeocystis globosa]QRN72734.1 preprotein translocase subunit SecA [Phaeocystis globosa]QRN72842.1 preprotein translocase subunit SecA [Phaeocystis globosa]QRN72950.1 preprotein translocase subunit SecA [Phaeocystis globosa]QRN73058.1 preprotein translocase subunit SecA [Phaeocystis globosa]
MFETFFQDSTKRALTKYDQLVNQINALEKEFTNLTDTQLRDYTTQLKVDLCNGVKSNDQITTEAFALVREATRRVLGLRHFDVQLVGGLILNEGKIAEMKTGEGKTLVALLPTFLNALYGQGVHVVTVNDYLARRDAESVGQVHAFLGLSVGLIQEDMEFEERKKNYACDVTYVTNNELGFDYLRDNMAFTVDEIVQRPFFYCVVDEVDAILIDEARTPLIISGPSKAPTQKYLRTTKLVDTLRKDIHYSVDEKNQNATLLEEGLAFCEQALGTSDLYNVEDPWIPYILNSVKAKELFVRNTHYIANEENEIIIVDEFTGRTMVGRRWSDGLHQAVEAKEGLPIQDESQTLASITYQNLFLLYSKLSGMTGTAKTEELEFEKIYNLQVIPVPTNRPIQRKDFPDLIYKNQYLKWQAIANECLEMYNLGRPVLVGTTTIEKSELLAALLTEYQLPYRLLNARPENIESESEIIAQAGCKNAITIATNMAGRGTDIVLGGNPKSRTLARFQQFISYSKSLTVADQVDLSNDELSTLSKLFKDIQFPDYIYTYTEALEYLESNSDLSIQLSEELKSNYLRLSESDKNIAVADRSTVQNLGGLHVIGTERHESRRIDNQLRGRSGRQGDPGSSRFFLSLEDKLLRIFGGDKISGLMQNMGLQESVPIQSKFLNQSLESAQKKVEAYYFDIRKKLFEYDQALNTQRNGVYIERRRILEIDSLRDWIIEYAERSLYDVVFFMGLTQNGLLKTSILQKVQNLLGTPFLFQPKQLDSQEEVRFISYLQQQFQISYDLKEAEMKLIEPGLLRELERSFLLQQIDFSWKEHLQKISALRDAVGWRAYGQKDPLTEYKQEAYNFFVIMLTRIRHRVVYFVLRSRIIIDVKN